MTTTKKLSIRDFIQELMSPEAKPIQWQSIDGAEPKAKIPDEPGQVVEVDEEAFDWFLDVLPPHYLSRGCFCFAEGIEPFTLFCASKGRFFARRLTWPETRMLCRLANIPPPGSR